MVYIPETEEEKAAREKLLSPSPGGQIVSNAPTGVSASTGEQGQSTGGGSSGGAGGIDFSKYISQNLPGTQRLAQSLSERVGREAGEARQAVSQAQQGFSERVKGQEVGLNEQLLEQLRSSPTQITQTPESLDQFLRMRDVNYTGPRTLQETDLYAPAFKETREAESAASRTATPEGLRTLLQERAGAKPVSPGTLRFDLSLLQATPSAQQSLAQARAGAAGIENLLGGAEQQAQQQAEQVAATNLATQQATRQALEEAQGTFRAGLEQAAEQRRADADLAYSRALQELGGVHTGLGEYGGQVSPETLADIGLTPEQFNLMNQITGGLENFGIVRYTPEGQPVYDSGYSGLQFPDLMNYQQFLNPGDITLNTVATPEDYARQEALNQLSLSPYSTITDTSRLGTAPEDVVPNFDIYKYLNNAAFLGNLATQSRWNAIRGRKKSNEDGGGILGNVLRGLGLTSGPAGDIASILSLGAAKPNEPLVSSDLAGMPAQPRYLRPEDFTAQTNNYSGYTGPVNFLGSSQTPQLFDPTGAQVPLMDLYTIGGWGLPPSIDPALFNELVNLTASRGGA